MHLTMLNLIESKNYLILKINKNVCLFRTLPTDKCGKLQVNLDQESQTQSKSSIVYSCFRCGKKNLRELQGVRYPDKKNLKISMMYDFSSLH